MQTIDAVIIWVDGSDPEWLQQKAQYENPNKHAMDSDSSIERFRDWSNLQYVFRGIETFAPWLRNIYFITWGHIPKWLNVNCDRLKIVKHQDYIPSKYLPTFNSHTIEHNLFRIEELSEHFVYFNDDMFLISNTKETDYFIDGLPVDVAGLNVHGYTDGIVNQLIPIMDIGIINKYFDMQSVITANKKNWYNLKYGPVNLRTLALSRAPRFPGMYYPHLPTSLRKSTMKHLWDIEFNRLDETCSHQFRKEKDVNQWLYRDWDIVSGEFYPKSYNFGKSFFLDRDGMGVLKGAVSYIKKQKGKAVCINDGNLTVEEFDLCRQQINNALNSILPNKSDFEL